MRLCRIALASSSVIPGISSQLLDAGSLDTVQRAKFGQQRFLARGSDAGNLVQARDEPLLAAHLAVGGDGKAVGFIADALHQVQPL